MGKEVIDYVEKVIPITYGKARKMYEYIKDHGTYFEGAVESSTLPRAFLTGFLLRAKVKECYYNAQILSLIGGFRDIKYYEGVGSWVAPVPHAWNVYQGKVIDLTWEKLPDVKLEEIQYFGVQIPRDFLRKKSPFRRGYAEMLLIEYLEEIGYIH